jgi:hypothetical protein
VIRVFNNMDIALLVVALPVFIAAGFPLGGWAVGSGAYLLQKGIAEYTRRKAADAESPRDIVGWMAGSLVLRGWLAAIAIFLVGILGSDKAGLAAAVVFLAAFTMFFSTRMMFRGVE